MENATNTMILDRELFAGLTTCTKNKALETIFRDWEMAVEMAHEKRLESFDAPTDEGKQSLKDRAHHYANKADTLRQTLIAIMAYNKAGDLDNKRMDDAFEVFGATERELEVAVQRTYWKRQEEAKEQALKAEYMAGFEAWKAEKASA